MICVWGNMTGSDGKMVWIFSRHRFWKLHFQNAHPRVHAQSCYDKLKMVRTNVCKVCLPFWWLLAICPPFSTSSLFSGTISCTREGTQSCLNQQINKQQKHRGKKNVHLTFKQVDSNVAIQNNCSVIDHRFKIIMWYKHKFVFVNTCFWLLSFCVFWGYSDKLKSEDQTINT